MYWDDVSASSRLMCTRRARLRKEGIMCVYFVSVMSPCVMDSSGGREGKELPTFACPI